MGVLFTRFGAKLSGIGYVENLRSRCAGPPLIRYKKSIESKPYHGATALLQRRFEASIPPSLGAISKVRPSFDAACHAILAPITVDYQCSSFCFYSISKFGGD